MDDRVLRIVILGGYGTFGRRLVELLADEARLHIFIAGRSKDKAEALRAMLAPAAAVEALALDRNGDLDRALAEIGPHILVDATGPFQAYGAEPYRLVEACLRHGVNYMDFSDSSSFTHAIAHFDPVARDKGLFVLSAVSSAPALSGAAARHLCRDMAVIDSVEAGIAPSPFAGIGRNVIEAITSYAGQPLRLLRDGRETKAFGLTETRRMTICPPGEMPLQSRCFALVDVPDLTMLPDVVANTRAVWFGAGPAPELYLRLLVLLAHLRRRRLVPALGPLAGLFHRTANRLTWGERRGGMYVSVKGHNAEGAPVARSWHLLAEGDTGPSVPAMAVDAVVRRCLAGQPPAHGARHAAGELTLADFARGFAVKHIVTGERQLESPSLPLYRRVLGNAWDRLPHAIRDLHEVSNSRTFSGRARVDRGKGFIARMIGALYGFPSAGTEIPVDVLLQSRHGGELWQRTFAGRRFRSFQAEGNGRCACLIDERFGPVSVGLALVVEGEQLHYVVRRWSFLGVPMPMFMAPAGRTFEFVAEGRFNFHVEIAHPWFGLIVRYQGWLRES
ncbi:DUF4166 domain-containing protein [Rhizobium sp.]